MHAVCIGITVCTQMYGLNVLVKDHCHCLFVKCEQYNFFSIRLKDVLLQMLHGVSREHRGVSNFHKPIVAVWC